LNKPEARISNSFVINSKSLNLIYLNALVNIVDLSGIRAVAFDLDGVIYLGGTMLPYADIAKKKLDELGIASYYITNNSTKTRQEIAHKLSSLGIEVSYRNIYSSAYLASRFIHEKYTEGATTVRVIGSDGLVHELQDAGIKIADKDCYADILLVGYDVNFNYQTIVQGFRLLLNGSDFLACNLEARYPIEGHQWMPGAASMVAAIEASSGKKPDFIIGKPGTFMLELIAREHDLEPEQILVVGDTPESDILMANNFGSPSILFVPDIRTDFRSLNHDPECKPSFTVKHHSEIISLVVNNRP
jgi:4-nitrophenyl phosphatase